MLVEREGQKWLCGVSCRALLVESAWPRLILRWWEWIFDILELVAAISTAHLVNGYHVIDVSNELVVANFGARPGS